MQYDDIPIGAENAISRQRLASLWGVSDRVARRRIAELRDEDNGDGYVIVSHSRDGVHGYYRTNDREAIQHFYNETLKRGRNTMRPLRKARRVLRQIEADSAGLILSPSDAV